MQYYEVSITIKGKGKEEDEDRFRIFDHLTKKLGTMDDVEKFLSEQYGGLDSYEKKDMYADSKEGSPKQVGWIYSFENADWSHAPVEEWDQQDWVTVHEISATVVII